VDVQKYVNNNSDDYNHPSKIDNISEFCKYIDWQKQGYSSYYIKTEHLFNKCETCGYMWLSKTLDNF